MGSTTESTHGPLQHRARRLGIDTHSERVVLMHKDCHVCRAEGFDSLARVEIASNGNRALATLVLVTGDMLAKHEVGLTEAAWNDLRVREGDWVEVRHAPQLTSLGDVRGKIFGRPLDESSSLRVVADIVAGRYSPVDLAAFLTACAARPLNRDEMRALTAAMVDTGERLRWSAPVVADKHCIGGLPGNRTTPIVVAIVAALGILIPKTSSRAITSPAGTADVMETLTTVDLELDVMRRVVEREGGCLVWGGAVHLSPADDIMIRIERSLDLDGEGQMVASVLSKKIAAGSTHVVIDVPVGPTAKVRSPEGARSLAEDLVAVASHFDLQVIPLFSDGRWPVGRGIGPALEARDVLAVLRNHREAPQDLRARAIDVAGAVVAAARGITPAAGRLLAEDALASGEAWSKFQAICEAQGGLREPAEASQRAPITAERAGTLRAIDNRRLSRLAKLAGAPDDLVAGLRLDVAVGDSVELGQPLCWVHADTVGELHYALEYAARNPDIFDLDPA